MTARSPKPYSGPRNVAQAGRARSMAAQTGAQIWMSSLPTGVAGSTCAALSAEALRTRATVAMPPLWIAPPPLCSGGVTKPGVAVRQIPQLVTCRTRVALRVKARLFKFRRSQAGSTDGLILSAEKTEKFSKQKKDDSYNCI